MGQLSSYRAHLELIYVPHMRGLNMRTLNKAIIHIPGEVNPRMCRVGPKMYLAYASQVSGEHIGSTFLHKDVTAAYNILLDAADSPTGEPGYALWHLWPSWSSPMLEEFILEEKLAYAVDGNPIHGQGVYLTEPQIEAFSVRYGIRPFAIRQRKGDAIFIPPGCPHQVIPYASLYFCCSLFAIGF